MIAALRDVLARSATVVTKLVTSRNFAICVLLAGLFWVGAWLTLFLQYYAFWRGISVLLLLGLLAVYARGFFEYFVAPKVDAAGLFYMGTWVYALGELSQALWSLYARATYQEHMLMTSVAIFWIFIKSCGFVLKLAVPSVEEGAVVPRYSFALIISVFLAGAATAAALFFLAAPALERLWGLSSVIPLRPARLRPGGAFCISDARLPAHTPRNALFYYK